MAQKPQPREFCTTRSRLRDAVRESRERTRRVNRLKEKRKWPFRSEIDLRNVLDKSASNLESNLEKTAEIVDLSVGLCPSC